jgi:small-conductance mechanosensitive channel
MMPRSILAIVQQAVDSVPSLFEGLARSFSEVPLAGGALRNLILSVVVIAAAVLVRRLVLRVVDRRIDDARARYRWSKVSSYVAFGTVAVFVIAIWLEAGTQLGTFLGLVGAGLAIALKDPVSDLAGWIFILWRRPFDLGDRVQVGEHAGDVVDIRVFQFTILEIGNWVAADQSTGRIIHVPNARVFTEPLANYTAQFDFLWTEIPVLVTFESDWKRAKALLEEVAAKHASGVSEEAERALRKASRKFFIFYQKLTPVVYTSVQDSGVLLTIRYLCKPRQRRGTAQAIWEAVLDALAAEPNVELAYPTYRAYLDPPAPPYRTP